MNAFRFRLQLHTALGLAPLLLTACASEADTDWAGDDNCLEDSDTDVDETDTDVVDTDTDTLTDDTDVVDTDTDLTDTDTDGPDTDTDTDVADTDTDVTPLTCAPAPDGNAHAARVDFVAQAGTKRLRSWLLQTSIRLKRTVLIGSPAFHRSLPCRWSVTHPVRG